MEEKQKKTAKTTSTTKKTSAPKKTTTQKTTKTTAKTATKTTTSKPKAKKEPKIDAAPKLTVIHEKKEEPIQELPIKKKEEKTLKKQNKLKEKEEKAKQKEDQKRIKEEKQKIKAEKAKKVKVKEEKTKKDKAKEEKTEKDKKKRYIEISVGSIVCVLIIVGLIVLNVKLAQHAFDVINNAGNENVQSNNIAVTQEIGNVLENNNELVTKIIEKITFAPNVTASVYEVGKFNENTIPNDLKLRLGWDVTKSEDKLQSMNENSELIESIEQKVMEQSIKNILGSNVEYEDEAFFNTNVNTFSTYAPNQGMIEYREGLYTSISTPIEETTAAPFVYQEVQKVVKYSEKIIVYVKVAYVNVNGETHSIYRDFTNGEFSRRLLQGTQEELFGNVSINYNTGEGTISVNKNTSLNTIRNKLNTYKYTFSLDESTKQYYLSEFEQEKSDE